MNYGWHLNHGWLLNHGWILNVLLNMNYGWSLMGGHTYRQTHTQTNRHINIMTWPDVELLKHYNYRVALIQKALHVHIPRGCSQIMSAENGWVQTPPPPFVSHCQHFPNPLSPLCQPLSAFPKPPLPPVSAVSICPTPPTFSASVLWTYLKPPHPEYPFFFREESTYSDKIY